MGILIVLAVIGFFGYRALSRWSDRKTTAALRNPDSLYQQQILRWVAGQGPDPREALFCNGVPVEMSEAPELSSLSWPRTPPPAPAQMPTRTTGSSTAMVSSTATNPG